MVDAILEASDVNTPIEAYNTMVDGLNLVQTIYSGTKAMREAQQTYLPQFKYETNTNYTNRLKTTFHSNFFKKTIKMLVGKAFAKPMVLADDVPEKIKEWAENIDLVGNHFNIFASHALRAGLKDGMCHILVDASSRPVDPETGKPVAITEGEAKARGERPYLCRVDARNLIGWRYDLNGGKEQLTQVRIREVAKVPDGAWGEKTLKRVRVLYPGRYEVYQEVDDGKGGLVWKEIEEGVTGLDFIPLLTFYTERTGVMTAEPPLQDLAFKNVEYWQSSSDQRNILTISRFPILAVQGWTEKDKEIPIGPLTMLKTRSPEGKYYYVEHTGAAIEAGEKDLERLEREMAMMGISMLTPQPGNTTATGRAIDTAEEVSDLQAMCLALADVLEEALNYIAKIGGLGDEGGSVKVDTDFGLGLQDAEDLQLLDAARGRKDISRPTYWDELKRRGVLSEDFDPVAEAELLEDEAPPPLDGIEMNLGGDKTRDNNLDKDEENVEINRKGKVENES